MRGLSRLCSARARRVSRKVRKNRANRWTRQSRKVSANIRDNTIRFSKAEPAPEGDCVRSPRTQKVPSAERPTLAP